MVAPYDADDIVEESSGASNRLPFTCRRYHTGGGRRICPSNTPTYNTIGFFATPGIDIAFSSRAVMHAVQMVACSRMRACRMRPPPTRHWCRQTLTLVRTLPKRSACPVSKQSVMSTAGSCRESVTWGFSGSHGLPDRSRSAPERELNLRVAGSATQVVTSFSSAAPITLQHPSKHLLFHAFSILSTPQCRDNNRLHLSLPKFSLLPFADNYLFS